MNHINTKSTTITQSMLTSVDFLFSIYFNSPIVLILYSGTCIVCIIANCIVLMLYTLFVSWFAWKFPIVRGSNTALSRTLSVLIAVFLTSLYAIIYASRFPLTGDNVKLPFVTIGLTLLFWPIAFALPIFNSDQGVGDGGYVV